MKAICKNCGEKLSFKQKLNNWKFGKIWFCRTTCAVAWAVKQHLNKNKKGRKQ